MRHRRADITVLVCTGVQHFVPYTRDKLSVNRPEICFSMPVRSIERHSHMVHLWFLNRWTATKNSVILLSSLRPISIFKPPVKNIPFSSLNKNYAIFFTVSNIVFAVCAYACVCVLKLMNKILIEWNIHATNERKSSVKW